MGLGTFLRIRDLILPPLTSPTAQAIAVKPFATTLCLSKQFGHCLSIGAHSSSRAPHFTLLAYHPPLCEPTRVLFPSAIDPRAPCELDFAGPNSRFELNKRRSPIPPSFLHGSP